MLRIVMLAVSLALLAPQFVLAQSVPGHVYRVIQRKAHPGSEAAYSQTYWDVLRPIWDQVVRQGGLISYVELSKSVGDTRDSTHMVFTEFEDWEAYANFGQELEEAGKQFSGARMPR